MSLANRRTFTSPMSAPCVFQSRPDLPLPATYGRRMRERLLFLARSLARGETEGRRLKAWMPAFAGMTGLIGRWIIGRDGLGPEDDGLDGGDFGLR